MTMGDVLKVRHKTLRPGGKCKGGDQTKGMADALAIANNAERKTRTTSVVFCCFSYEFR